jgi:hypothetical protein
VRTCAFCDLPSHTGDYTEPTMCQKHFDLILVAHKTARREGCVTVEGIKRELDLLPTQILSRLAFGRKEIGALLRQARKGGYSFFGKYGRVIVHPPEKIKLTTTKERKHANSD